jgi:hypothetical protein
MTGKRSPRSRLYSDATQNETANLYVIEMLYNFFWERNDAGPWYSRSA